MTFDFRAEIDFVHSFYFKGSKKVFAVENAFLKGAVQGVYVDAELEHLGVIELVIDTV